VTAVGRDSGFHCIAASATVIVRRKQAPIVEVSTLADVRLGDVIMVRCGGGC